MSIRDYECDMRTTVSLDESNSAYVEQLTDDEDSNAEAIRQAVDRARRLEAANGRWRLMHGIESPTTGNAYRNSKLNWIV